MARSIRRLGLAGVALAFVLIAGLNFSALERQWNVPYLGIQEAYAWSPCKEGGCRVTVNGTEYYLFACWKIQVYVIDHCAPAGNCPRCRRYPPI